MSETGCQMKKIDHWSRMTPALIAVALLKSSEKQAKTAATTSAGFCRFQRSFLFAQTGRPPMARKLPRPAAGLKPDIRTHAFAVHLLRQPRNCGNLFPDKSGSPLRYDRLVRVSQETKPRAYRSFVPHFGA